MLATVALGKHLALMASSLVAAGALGSNGIAANTGSAVGDTCAFTGKGRLIGCLDDASDCALIDYWRKGAGWFATQEIGPKEIELPPPVVAAELIRPGVWRVVNWRSKRVIGAVAATNKAKTRWRITDKRRAFIAMARGPGGPPMAAVLLYFGTDDFC